MDIKGQNRLMRIEQIKKLQEKNRDKPIGWIILKAQSEYGFSERLIKEYLKIIQFQYG